MPIHRLARSNRRNQMIHINVMTMKLRHTLHNRRHKERNKKPRVIKIRKTHCSRGHERTPENLYNDRQCKLCHNIQAKTYVDPNPNRARIWKLTRMGWTLEMVEAKRIAQNNCCEICGTQFVKTPDADHKHVEPPIPRGLLCNHCNQAVGHLKDSAVLCRAAADYLERYDKENSECQLLVASVCI